MRVIWNLPLEEAGTIVELDSGSRLRIRPIRPSDRDAIRGGFDQLSPESRYHRFFTALPELSDALLSRLVDIDHRRHLAWLVFDPDPEVPNEGRSERLVGAARFIMDENSEAESDPCTAEVAVTVIDEYQGKGIGRFLIDLLTITAAQVGVARLRFEVLRENRNMKGLLVRLGAKSERIADEPAATHFFLDVPSDQTLDPPAGALYELLRLLNPQ